MMTDPYLYGPALRRRSVFESDNDPMNSTASPLIYLSRFIPSGQAESHPNVFGSGFIQGVYLILFFLNANSSVNFWNI